MGKLISITTSSKSSESCISAIKDVLTANGSSVYICKQNWHSKKDNSPYVSAIFDVNNRYEQQNKINTNLNKYDYVLLDGYTSNTMISEISKFDNSSAKRTFCIWLDSIESVTYGIRRPDYAILYDDGKNPNYDLLAKMFPRDFILSNKNTLNILIKENIVNHNESLDIQNPKLYETKLIDIIRSYSLNKIHYEIIYKSDEYKDNRMLDLLNIRQLILKREPNNYYYQSLITPIGIKVKSSNKIISRYNNALIKFSNDQDGAYISSQVDFKPQINVTPLNEIELSNNISWIYGIDSKNLDYTKRMRLLESWVMNVKNQDNYLIYIEVICKLSYHDILVLSRICPGIQIDLKMSNASYGFIDTSDAPKSIVELVDKAFDVATVYSAVTNIEDYLLLGHITNAKLHLNTNNVLNILKFDKSAGTYLLNNIIKDINNVISEKYPILYTSLK